MREGVKERGKEEEKEEQDVRNINQLPPVHTPSGDQICNLGMCPDCGN